MRRCMAIISASCRQMLLGLLQLSKAQDSSCGQLAGEVAHVYATIAEQKVTPLLHQSQWRWTSDISCFIKGRGSSGI